MDDSTWAYFIICDLVAYFRLPGGAGCINLSISVYVMSNPFPSNLARKELKLCIYQRKEMYSKKARLTYRTI
jgi:hypothetical protein